MLAHSWTINGRFDASVDGKLICNACSILADAIEETLHNSTSKHQALSNGGSGSNPESSDSALVLVDGSDNAPQISVGLHACAHPILLKAYQSFIAGSDIV